MATSFHTWCAATFGQLLSINPSPELLPAVAGWPNDPPARWEQAWESRTRDLVARAGTTFSERRLARGEVLATTIKKQAALVNRDTLHAVVGERLAIARQDGFRCDPSGDFWYVKINHGYWEQLYAVYGDPDPTKMRISSPDHYRRAYIDSGFTCVLEALVSRYVQDDGTMLSFSGMHLGVSLEAGNHDHDSVLHRFPSLDYAGQRVAIGATIGLLAVFESLYGKRSISFADGSFPKRAIMGGWLRETLTDFGRHSDRVVFVVPPHLRGLTLDGVDAPQATLPVPRHRVHECWAAALQATVEHIVNVLNTVDRVLVITQCAVFSAMLGLFLRAAKESLIPAQKRIFFFDLGQVTDIATPESGGVWITRHTVDDRSLFRIVGSDSKASHAQR